MNAIISQVDAKLESIQEVLKELNLPHDTKEACFQSFAVSGFEIKEYFNGTIWTLQSKTPHTKAIKTLLKHQAGLFQLVFQSAETFLIHFDKASQIPDFFNTYLKQDLFKSLKDVTKFLDKNNVYSRSIKANTDANSQHTIFCLVRPTSSGCDGVLATKMLSEIQDAFQENPLNRFPYMTKDGEVFATPGY